MTSVTVSQYAHPYAGADWHTYTNSFSRLLADAHLNLVAHADAHTPTRRQL